MQFLVYLTVLMVSISTVLLEVHWLTSPPPQPKPAVQAANTPRPVPKVEGPSDALSPVYPKKPQAVENAATAQQPAADQSQPQQSQPQQAPAVAQKPQAETTGMAARDEESRESSVAVQPVTNASPNSCDVQACASAHRSFRASDCTYQPFEGARRVCEKAPVTRSASRDPSIEMRRSAREIQLRDREDRIRAFRDDEDDQMGADDSDRDPPGFFLFGGRSRRW